VPAGARAKVSSSTITSWVSSQPGTPPNNPYLIYYDNPPSTTLTVSGNAAAASGDTVDIDCFYGSPTTMVKLAGGIPVQGGAFAPGPSEDLVRRMAARGAPGVGQSSWGPAVYGIVGSEAAAHELAGRMAGEGSVEVVRFDNGGARVEAA